MNGLRQIFDFYIHSSIHVALAVVSLTWITLLDFEIPYDQNLLYFIFFASITGYNFVKYAGLAKLYYRSLANWMKLIQVFSLFCFILMCYFAFKIQTKTLCIVGVFALITFLYAIPCLPKRYLLYEKQNLRNVGGIKIYIIALVWCGVSVFLPLVNHDVAITGDMIITAVQRFVFVIVLTLPFEIRDLQFDSIKLLTIPQKIGEKRAKIIGVVLLVFFIALEWFKVDSTISKLMTLLITAITFLLLMGAEKNQGKYYSAFWVEGIPILWLMLLLIF